MIGSDFVSCAGYALSLLRRNAGFWLWFAPLFFMVVNALTLVPFIGYVLRQLVFAVLGGQILVMLSEAAAGRQVRLRTLGGAAELPVSSFVLLAGAALFPFIAGLVVLAAGDSSHTVVPFFIGNMYMMRPPEVAEFFKLNVVMQVASAPFAFLGYFICVQREAASSAWRRAFSLACDKSHILAVFLVANLGLEYAADFRTGSSLNDAVCVVVFIAFGLFQIALAFAIPARSEGAARARVEDGMA